jgi:Mg-chelatase subunit ChlD
MSIGLGRSLVVLVVVASAVAAATADEPRGESTAAFGTLEARTRQGTDAPLTLESVSVDVQQAGDVARTEVEHVFRNPTAERLEGTFRFPLPEGATLVGLAMEIDGALVEGDLLEREQARRIYQDIVDRMRDPAILEWQGGRTLQLRVFPIEPRSDKRVVVRYLVPLEREGATWSYTLPTGGLRAPLPRFQLRFGGEIFVDEKGYRPETDVVVRIPAAHAPAIALRETRDDGLYTSVRLSPDWSRVPFEAAPKRDGRSVLLIVDVSRSMLESRGLLVQSVATLLRSLEPTERFALLAMDLTAREAGSGFVPATPQAIDEALAFLSGIEPDGASDFGAALRRAGEILAASPGEREAAQVVYVGDGRPTWGETEPDALRALATTVLGSTPFHAVVLGSEPDTAFLKELADHLGGRIERPRTRAAVERFAAWLRKPDGRNLRELRVTTSESEQRVLPAGTTTLAEGEEIVALVRTPVGQEPLASLRLEGVTRDGRFEQTLVVPDPVSTPYVAQRWARAEIDRLESGKASKEEVIGVSKAFRVLSRYTAFLVLEAQERRRRFEEPEEGGPAISGRDLESVGSDASLSPDRIQPGDPEIRIAAPADARAVVVVFPWGETKVARYEQALGAWTVRFLIDKNTVDGRYPVVVRITHADGRAESLKLFYTVDTRAPAVRLSVQPAAGRPGVFEVRAVQVMTPAEVSEGVAVDASAAFDARRVEVQMPDGRLLALASRGHGQFRGYWKPRRPPLAPIPVRVVAVDRALNRNVFTVTVDPRPGAVVAER